MSSRALRKLQNDDDLLESILNSKAATKGNSASKTKPTPAKNVNMFSLMNNDNNSSDEEPSEDDSEEEEINKTFKLSTKSQKKNKRKAKNKQAKKNINNQSEEDEEDLKESDDEDLDRLLQEYKKKDIRNIGNKTRQTVNDDEDEFFTASESEDEYVITEVSNGTILNDLETDTSFEKFPFKCLKHSTKFFNSDFKTLDPHSEFKLLFDDISAESLEDIDSMTSTSISPQQLKQIQRMKRLVRNWGGKNHRNVPNGPGGSIHVLKFSKVREDWIPTQRGELGMKLLNMDELIDWQLWQRPTDWKDLIEEDLRKWKKDVSFYKFEPLNDDINKKAMTEFYLSVIVHPDHEALINLISSKYPYHIPSLLQVALITIRQGDRSNTNGLLQRALFVFDRALKASIKFDALSCQLPYIYFFNRQFYLAIFRYILALAQRGAVTTAGEWCKSLWSLSPLEDPLGCRYFIDHYLLLNKDYQYIIDMSKSPLMNTYKQWYTMGFSLATVLSYFKIEEFTLAKEELLKCFKNHPIALSILFTEKLVGSPSLTSDFDLTQSPTETLEAKAYATRFSAVWKNTEEINFLHTEISKILEDYKQNKLDINVTVKKGETDQESANLFFIDGIPINLLRFAILSEESSVMASIPANIWSDYEVYEFDVLPPVPTSKESLDVLETVKSFINDRDLMVSQAEMLQDEELLNQIRQISLQQYIQQNETENLE